MSDWDVDALSLEAWVTDLETVVDAVGAEHFPILGISQGGPVAIAYAVQQPGTDVAPYPVRHVRARWKEAFAE
jgi:pimeloyl-ACP methyl ester carboxylesterase